jgi:hypothetical protein
MTLFNADTFGEFDQSLIPRVQGPGPELAAIYKEFDRAGYERSFNLDGKALDDAVTRHNEAVQQRQLAAVAGRLRANGEHANLSAALGRYEPPSIGDIAAMASARADKADEAAAIREGIASGAMGYIDTGAPEAVAHAQGQQRATYEDGWQRRREAVRDELVRRLPGRSTGEDESLRYRNGGPITGQH